MEVFSKIPTLQQQQFVYMIDCVWSFLIACVFNLQIRRLQFASVKGGGKAIVSVSQQMSCWRSKEDNNKKQEIYIKTRKTRRRITVIFNLSRGFGENVRLQRNIFNTNVLWDRKKSQIAHLSLIFMFPVRLKIARMWVDAPRA